MNRFERRPARTMAALWLSGFLLMSFGFEACYRSQWIDFYQADLRRVNEPRTLEPGFRAARTVLTMGDSFTAWPDSYPAIVRDRLGSAARVINSG